MAERGREGERGERKWLRGRCSCTVLAMSTVNAKRKASHTPTKPKLAKKAKEEKEEAKEANESHPTASTPTSHSAGWHVEGRPWVKDGPSICGRSPCVVRRADTTAMLP